MTRQGSQPIRRIIIEQSKRAGVGHIGCALSVADIIGCLYEKVLRISDPDDPERDRFVLSKGHAALALYAALHVRGFLSQEQLDTYCGDGSLLGVHPEHELRGVDFSTGSLGLGLSFGTGAALAARLQGSTRRVYVLLSDAECNEGSTWEAIMFAGHHKLSNLVAVVDFNQQQALGRTEDVLNQRHIADRWRAFGWIVREVDGNDSDELVRHFSEAESSASGPTVLIAHTVFGKGVSFMEKQIKWHYLPLSDADYSQAMEELSLAS